MAEAAATGPDAQRAFGCNRFFGLAFTRKFRRFQLGLVHIRHFFAGFQPDREGDDTLGLGLPRPRRGLDFRRPRVRLCAFRLSSFGNSGAPPVGPVGPVTPLLPLAPLTPAAPVGPAAPVAPVAPLLAAQPGFTCSHKGRGPCGPAGPVAPFEPLAPLAPAGPVAPVTPLLPLARLAPLLPLAPLRCLAAAKHERAAVYARLRPQRPHPTPSPPRAARGGDA